MDFTDNSKYLTLDCQYIVKVDIDILRLSLFDLFQQHSVMCRVKPNPHLIYPQDELNHIQLLDLVWSEFGELELINLDGSQTLLRLYRPGPIELSELEKHEHAIRQFLSRPGIEIWFYENMGWTNKVIEVFAEEIYNHRLDCLRKVQDLLMNKLLLIPYPLSYFQIQPAPQIGISQFQPDSSQLQPGISQKLADTPRTQVGLNWDIPSEHSAEENNISLNKGDQELQRLWTKGLTAKEIGIRTGKTVKTVANRLSVLRRMYGEDRFPLRNKTNRKI